MIFWLNIAFNKHMKYIFSTAFDAIKACSILKGIGLQRLSSNSTERGWRD